MKLSIHFCLHNKLFVILLFCGMDFLDIGPDGHEKIYRYRLVNDMSGKDILFLSSSPSLPWLLVKRTGNTLYLLWLQIKMASSSLTLTECFCFIRSLL